jgi:hypothetical protein
MKKTSASTSTLARRKSRAADLRARIERLGEGLPPSPGEALSPREFTDQAAQDERETPQGGGGPEKDL